jgi:hypothetical protein
VSTADHDLARLGDIPDPLAGDAGGDLPPPPPRAALGDAPTRALTQKRRWLAAGAIGCWLLATAFVLGVRGDLAGATLRGFVQIAIPAVAGAAVLGLAIARGAEGLGARTGRLVAALGAASALFAGSALLGSGVLLDDTPGTARAIAGCFAHVLAIGGVPLLALAFGLKRAFPANAPWRSVLAASGAGLFGAAALGVHCSTRCGLHMVLGHALPAVLLAFVGGALLARVTRA